jgi:pseudouridine kinase
MVDVVTIGGANIDIKAKAMGDLVPGTSNLGTVTVSPGGVARNIAHDLAVLGERTALLAVLGNDAASETVLAATRAAGVEVRHVLRTDANADSYVATLDGKGELVAAISAMSNVAKIDAAFVASKQELLKRARYVVADCNLEAGTLRQLIELYGEKLLIDPVSVVKARRLLEAGQRLDVLALTPNRDQLRALTGTSAMEDGCRRLHECGVSNVVVHLGSSGAFLFHQRGTAAIPAINCGAVTDVTGAGDAAVAGLVHGLLRGVPMETAVRWGQAAAGMVVASQLSTLKDLPPGGLRSMVSQ